MKFSVKQEKISKALQVVTRAVPTKASLPILNNILLSAENNQISLSATNLETAIKVDLDAVVTEPGIMAVPARILKDFILSLSDETLKFETDKTKLKLKSENSKTVFNGINHQDYPSLPKISRPQDPTAVQSQTLNKINQHVSFSASNDITKGVFTGILIDIQSKDLTAVCTDGNRLSEYKIQLSNDNNKDLQVIIPAKTFIEVTKIFSTENNNIEIFKSTDENLLIFKSEDILVATRILDGNYPDYKSVIPTDFNLTANFSLTEFEDAVKKTNIFAKETDGSTIKLKFDPVEKQIVISSQAEVSGENQSIIAADIDGDLLEASFNSKYLLDFCTNFKVENITLKTNSATSPFLFLSEEDKNYLHLVMPLQTFN